MTENERKILEMQAPSTRRCLERSPDLDLEWFNRIIPKESQVKDENGNVFHNHRPLAFKEVEVEEKLRRSRGGYIADARKETAPSSVGEEKRNTAIEAFMTSRTIEGIKNAFKALMAGVKETVKYGTRFRE